MVDLKETSDEILGIAGSTAPYSVPLDVLLFYRIYEHGAVLSTPRPYHWKQISVNNPSLLCEYHV